MMCGVAAPQPHPHVAITFHTRAEGSPPQPPSQQGEDGRRDGIDWVTSAQTELWGPFVVRSRTRALPHEKTPCIKQLGLKGKLAGAGTQTFLYVLWTLFIIVSSSHFFPF